MKNHNENSYIGSNTEPSRPPDLLGGVDAKTDLKRLEAAVERQFGPDGLTTLLTERSIVRSLGAHERDSDSMKGV